MNRLLLMIVAGVMPAAVFCAEESISENLLLSDDFERDEIGRGWNSTTGEWRVQDGVLRGKEIKDEKHSAATRRVLETRNAVYELRFRFVGDGQAFHFGFDPARGELKKKGHLFSLIVTPTSWAIRKHVDKNRPQEDPNETLASGQTPFKKECWFKLRVTTRGRTVTAQIEGKEPLTAEHSTFGVRKPTLVFRCLGDGVEIDDIRVTALPEE